MNNLLNNKWAWAVAILVIINFASIGVMWATFYKRGHHMRPDDYGHNMDRHPGSQSHMGKGSEGRGNERDFFSNALSLTPEQKVAFKKLKEEHFKAMETNMKEMATLRKEVIQQLGKPEEQVDPTFQKIGALEIQNQKEMFKHFNDMYALCTDSQKVILKDKLSNVMAHHRPGMGMHQKSMNRHHGRMGKKHHGYGNNQCCIKSSSPDQEPDEVEKTKE